MNNCVIEYGEGKYVGGFSLKTQKVYYTTNPAKAKKFSAISVQAFIAKYANQGYNLDTNQVTIHIIKRGAPSVFIVPGVTKYTGGAE